MLYAAYFIEDNFPYDYDIQERFIRDVNSWCKSYLQMAVKEITVYTKSLTSEKMVPCIRTNRITTRQIVEALEAKVNERF